MAKRPSDRYLDELSQDHLRKPLIRACEASLEVLPLEDSQETKDLLRQEQLFNHLSIA